MGPRFRNKAGEMFARVVSEYPSSVRVKDATKRLQQMEMTVPQPDAKALERARLEKASYVKPGPMTKSMRLALGGPDISHAAKFGQPTMTDPKKTLPASIPAANNDPAPANGLVSSEVTALVRHQRRFG